jgi:hypothetical protein
MSKLNDDTTEHSHNKNQSLRENKNLKPEINDDDFDIGIITDCVKTYFRNIHKQVSDRSDTKKAQRAQERKDSGRQRARRQNVSCTANEMSNIIGLPS